MIVAVVSEIRLVATVTNPASIEKGIVGNTNRFVTREIRETLPIMCMRNGTTRTCVPIEEERISLMFNFSVTQPSLSFTSGATYISPSVAMKES
jgi:hypothetical protein